MKICEILLDNLAGSTNAAIPREQLISSIVARMQLHDVILVVIVRYVSVVEMHGVLMIIFLDDTAALLIFVGTSLINFNLAKRIAIMKHIVRSFLLGLGV